MKRPGEEKLESLPVAIKVRWIDGMQFVAYDDRGHSVVMDVSREHGGEGSGFGPIQLLLVALGGCTGMDIVEMMRKQRQKLEGLEIIVSGERVAEHPRVYGKVHVEYMFRGKELEEKAVQRAVKLSQSKYCSVAATLRPMAKVSYGYVIQQT